MKPNDRKTIMSHDKLTKMQTQTEEIKENEEKQKERKKGQTDTPQHLATPDRCQLSESLRGRPPDFINFCHY